MENLVQISNNLVVTSSFQVAEHFHKEHRNVLRTIREYINQLKNEQIDNWFYETNYIDDKNREYPMYLMNRDGFSLLVMGFIILMFILMMSLMLFVIKINRIWLN